MKKASPLRGYLMSRLFNLNLADPKDDGCSAKGDEFMRRAMLVQRNAQYPNETLLRNVMTGYSDSLLEKMLVHMDGSKSGILLTRSFVLLTENRIDASLIEGFAESVNAETQAVNYELYGHLALYRNLLDDNTVSIVALEAMLASTLKAFAAYAISSQHLYAPPLPGLTDDENNLLLAMFENPDRIDSIIATVLERSSFRPDVIQQVVTASVLELAKGAL
jgi:hypothetical protein